MELPGSERVRRLAQMAADWDVDKTQPILRYYRSGAQMVRTAYIYEEEESYENAYFLYMKYLTLFLEKICAHPEFRTVSTAEKTRTANEAKKLLPRSEKLKLILTQRYDEEHSQWQRQEEERRRRREEEERRKQEEDGERLREEITKSYHEEKERTMVMQRDFEVALYNQLQWNKELEQEATEENRRRRLEEEAAKRLEPRPSTSEPMPSAPSIPDRSTKPNLSLFSSSDKLRTLVVPAMVMAKFLSVAQSNTSSNIETCAILSGRLSRDKFSITHVIVPKQKGTPDSCSTLGEEELFEYQDKHELITLGWIHTHPSQTAFLSSVDLHTHLSYQLMLPEALAIVCAPKHNQTGFFMLTENHGLQFIGKCRQSGFHPHPSEPPLFSDASHVEMDHNGDVTLVDLR